MTTPYFAAKLAQQKDAEDAKNAARAEAIDNLIASQATYDVKWMREGEDEVLECRKLTETQFIRRLIGANHNFGRITIVEVERSGDD